MKIYAFTGTQIGMTARQISTLRQLLTNIGILHLGDCVGADAQAWLEAKTLGVKTIGHPPTDKRKRAFCAYDVERPAQPYLKRNREMVAEGVDGLIATPKDYVEPGSKRGQGTWTTIGYARQVGRRILNILPDGSIREEHGRWTQPTEDLLTKETK